MTTPSTFIDDEEGGNGKILPPYYVAGWTWQNRGSLNELAPATGTITSTLPNDQVFLFLTQQYNDGDSNPLGGFLTFMPSEAFTINEGTSNWRVLQRLVGTDTWPSVSSGGSPWNFSLDRSGKNFIWGGLVTVRLAATDNPNITTDSGNPLTYHVVEHFLGGQEFDITVPMNTSVLTTSIRQLMVTGSAVPYKYDPMNPLGNNSSPAPAPGLAVSTPGVQQIVFGSTEPVIADVGAAIAGSNINISDIENDDVFFAFISTGADPLTGDFHAGTWIAGGPPYEAFISIGPENGGLNLAVGRYIIYLKLVDFPSVPIVNIGTLIIS